MATKTLVNEREYTIPLRREWQKVARYKRTSRSVKEIKSFIAKHMRIPDRDATKVKLDLYLNNELWLRGAKKPLSKIKVKAKRSGDLVNVELVQTPKQAKFAKARSEKIHKKVEKKKPKVDEKKEETKTESSEQENQEEKRQEKEKSKAAAESKAKIAQQTAKAEKHTVKGTGPQVQRKALKK